MCPRLLLISYTIRHYNIEYIREEKRGGKKEILCTIKGGYD